MAATYDATLPSDADWVRFLVRDTAVSAAILQDEEIAAVLADEPNKWFAAARVGEVMLARTHGLTGKQVDDLSLTWGDSPESSFRAAIQGWREEGARRILASGSRPTVFRVLQ